MERRDFVCNACVMLVLAATGGLAACSKGGDDNPDPDPGPGGNARLTVDLSNDLGNVGDFKIGGGVIVIRTAAGNAAGSFTALSSTCTHEGNTVARYNKGSGLIECDFHGSRFTTSGAVNTGPATTALQKFTVQVEGSTLRVV
jgi:cytochrome b6-f complex iron-sulfur subunit